MASPQSSLLYSPPLSELKGPSLGSFPLLYPFLSLASFGMIIFLRISISILFLGLIDWYAYQAVKTAFGSTLATRLIYWGLSGGMWLFLLVLVASFDRQSGPHDPLFKWYAGALTLLLVPKLILIIGLLGEDVLRFITGLVHKVSGSEGAFWPERRRVVSLIGLGLAAIPFAGILHGIWKGRYNYRVIRQTLYFPDLPAAFDGLRITQISDIHSGSFDNREKIRYGIDLINAQKSDLLLFTGDLVNSRAEEMEPWMKEFKRLKAPLGKYSILGNHDYGDYVEWESPEAKEANMQRLYAIEAELGFDLLRNENRRLSRGGDAIRLAGVENWGAGGFAKYGDLDKALQDLAPEDFTILLSHDPSHFDHQVVQHRQAVQLTLSGHTHGMQFGIEIPGWVKWSPVKYRYPRWAGLYQEAGRKLYVNRGFGFLAFPGRVGIWPEITVLELRRGSSPASA